MTTWKHRLEELLLCSDLHAKKRLASCTRNNVYCECNLQSISQVIEKFICSWVWWFIPIIPAVWKQTMAVSVIFKPARFLYWVPGQSVLNSITLFQIQQNKKLFVHFIKPSEHRTILNFCDQGICEWWIVHEVTRAWSGISPHVSTFPRFLFCGRLKLRPF